MRNKTAQVIRASAILLVGIGLGLLLHRQAGPSAPKQVESVYSPHLVNKLLVNAFEYGFTNALTSCQNGELSNQNTTPEQVRQRGLETYMAIMQQGE